MKVYCKNLMGEGPAWIWRDFGDDIISDIDEGVLTIESIDDADSVRLEHIFAPGEWRQASRI